MPKSLLRYPGGKSKQAEMILKYMPQGTKEYREPFVGGGGVYFALEAKKYPQIQKRWINDLNDGLIAVYTALRDRGDSFIVQCRDIAAPSRGEEEVSTKGTGKKYNKRLGEIFKQFSYDDKMDQALRYLFINRTVWAGRVNYAPGFESRMYYSNPSGWNLMHRVGFLESVRDHISGTEITKQDYSVLLTTPGSGVWVYLDPPYVVDTRLNKGSKLYEFGFDWAEHQRFVQVCKSTSHKIAISYDDVPEVRDWFRIDDGFYVYEHTWTYSGTTQEEKTKGKELIITNYPREDRLFVEPSKVKSVKVGKGKRVESDQVFPTFT